MHDQVGQQNAGGDKEMRLTAEELREINERVESFLKLHPDAPRDVVSFLRRKEGEPPHVNPRDKVRYMDAFATTSAIAKPLSGPLQVTQANSIQEAIDISLKDIKKAAN